LKKMWKEYQRRIWNNLNGSQQLWWWSLKVYDSL